MCRPPRGLTAPRPSLRRALLAALVAGACVSCAAPEAPPEIALLDGLGTNTRSVTTRSPAAQRYFDQGLVLCFGFDHQNAIRSFREAARLDPGCAMAYWGIALALGPHINNPVMDSTASVEAVAAVGEAQRRLDACSPVERDLVAALATRYAAPPPGDRRSLDEAYAAAMREVWRSHPDDPDVGALFAEALMDLRPWDLWSPEGEPRPETPEVVATLETVLAAAPDHPLANHLYIHAVEASPEPGRALPAADRLRKLVPAQGHLTHMPSHVDIRLGRYDEAVLANQQGITADLRRADATGRGGFYLIYRAHNYHFLAYAAMFDGRKATALQAARDLQRELTPELVRQYPDFLDAFLAVPTHVMVRFGMWDELLAEPAPPDGLPAAKAFWHCGRTVALSALGRVEEAAAELQAFDAAYLNVPESSIVGNNPTRVVLDVGRPFAEGELEYRRGNHDRAFELLREAVRRDDALRYDEPWGWMEPVRHALGALLLEQGRVAEAEEVYRKDLALHPGNGWALHGLAECLRRSGQTEEAAQVEERFRASWSSADVTIRASCYCRTHESA